MKRMISFMLTVLMIMSMLPNLTVQAAGLPTLTAQTSDSEVSVGDSFEVSVGVANNPGVSALKVKVKYDQDLLTLNKCVNSKKMSNMTQNSGSGVLTLLWDHDENMTEDTTLATLTFSVQKEFADSTKIEVLFGNDSSNWDEEFIDWQDASAVSVTLKSNKEEENDSGELSWKLSNDGVLTFSGGGAIPDRAFSANRNIKSVIIPNTVTEIGEAAFSNCINLSDITIANSVTAINSYAFYNCGSLASIELPDSVTVIGEEAFYNCNCLQSIAFGTGLDTIGAFAFDGCSLLFSVSVASGNNSYSSQNGILYNKDKTTLIFCPAAKSGSITIPSSVTTIGDWAFSNCNDLTGITLPSKLTSIEAGAFEDCSGLKSITIPNSVKFIGYNAFKCCESLSKITIPDSVVTIGDWAFRYSGLESITIGAGVATIGEYALDSYNLTTIIVAVENQSYSSQNGILYSKDKTVLYRCPFKTTGNIAIPNGVVTIAPKAFMGCRNITSVTIPNTTISIGEMAFASCYDLTSVTIPASVTSIGAQAFSGCSDFDVYYGGADVLQFFLIMDSENEALQNANIHYTSEHLWDNGVITKEATCKDKGVKTYTCSCGETKTEEIAKNSNNHTGGTEIRNKKDATCTEDGYSGDTYCKGCGAKTTDGTVIPATQNHTWNTGVVTTPATCKDNGVKTYTCSCGETKTEEIAKNPNNHTGGTEISNKKDATCTEDGYSGDTCCKGCGITLSTGKKIQATGHDPYESYEGDGEWVTCCRTCGEYLYSRNDEDDWDDDFDLDEDDCVSGCDWDSGKVTRHPTLTKTGIKTYTCRNCYDTEEEIIPKLKKTALSKAKVTLSKTSMAYTGKAQKPTVKVQIGSVYTTVPKSQYTVSYSKNTKIGTAKVTIKATSKSTYLSGRVTKTFKITKANNPMSVSPASKSFTVAACKKKAQSLTIKASKAQGTVSYKSSNTKYVTVSSKGKVTIKKGTPAGTYKITVTAKGNGNYKSATKTVIITVK